MYDVLFRIVSNTLGYSIRNLQKFVIGKTRVKKFSALVLRKNYIIE